VGFRNLILFVNFFLVMTGVLVELFMLSSLTKAQISLKLKKKEEREILAEEFASTSEYLVWALKFMCVGL
jgi:hypothetical protein